MNYQYTKLPSVENDYENERVTVTSYILWKRLKQCNAKLSNVSEFASLMSFFAVLSAVELKLEIGEASEELIIALVATTSLLVAVTMIVKTVTCSIVPYLESVVDVLDVSRSPHEEMISLINSTWLVGNVVCPSLFIVDLAIMTWIKFKNIAFEAAYAAMAILTPLLIIILIFGLVYYRQNIKPREQEFSIMRAALQTVDESEVDAFGLAVDSGRVFSDTDSDRTSSVRSDSNSGSVSSLATSESSYNSQTSLVKHAQMSNIYGAMLSSDPRMIFGIYEQP